MTDTYELHLSIEAHRPDQLAETLRRIARHVEADHDLQAPGRVVDTITAGGEGTPSWSVHVDHACNLKLTTHETREAASPAHDDSSAIDDDAVRGHVSSRAS